MAEQRYRAVLAVISDGRTVKDVAAAVGLSRQTVHCWLDRYEVGGLEGLTIGRIGHRPRSHRGIDSHRDVSTGGQKQLMYIKQERRHS